MKIKMSVKPGNGDEIESQQFFSLKVFVEFLSIIGESN
jgi:hypothetical protein